MTGKKIIALWRNIREAGSIGAVYRNGDWLTRCSRNYEDSINNRRQREISSNKLKCSNQDYAHLTLRKIMFLKFLERNGGYSWQHILLVSGGHDITTCAFDAKGQIRFYLAKKGKAYGIYPMSGGRFIYTEKYVSIPSYFIPQGGKYYDMDYLGGVSKTYFTPNGIHHCAKEMEPGGNYIMGSSSFSGSSENAVVEIDRETGEIVKMLVMDSLFDDYYQNVKDWCHVNSLDYNGQEHSVIISLRNIHAVVKVDWETFELK